MLDENVILLVFDKVFELLDLLQVAELGQFINSLERLLRLLNRIDLPFGLRNLFFHLVVHLDPFLLYRVMVGPFFTSSTNEGPV